MQQLEANFAHVCRCYDVAPAKIAKLNGNTANAAGIATAAPSQQNGAL